jgi:hypothetical protein
MGRWPCPTNQNFYLLPGCRFTVHPHPDVYQDIIVRDVVFWSFLE